jgi:hypothetical protein
MFRSPSWPERPADADVAGLARPSRNLRVDPWLSRWFGGVAPGGVEVVGGVGGGFFPAVLEVVEESVFDFAGDVGVGLLDLVFEFVAEA